MLANTTIVIGVILILLGLAGYFGTGAASITALIPAWFGIPLALLGILARKAACRKLAMHIAVTVGLLGFLGSAYSLVKRVVTGGAAGHPVAVTAQALMAVLTAIFVAMCVKSFIDARRNPQA